MSFFGDALGLELAQVFPERKVALYWIGRRGDSMLRLWEVGTGPQRLSLHVAFGVDLDNLLQAAERLREKSESGAWTPKQLKIIREAGLKEK